MPILKPIYFASVLVLALLTTATAQESATAQRSTLTITASAAGEQVRITAPASIVQMHVEVYAVSGEKLFDQEIRGGNVFDWHLQNGQGQRLAAGDYVCVVTAKSVSGKLTQKIGAVTVAENSVNVKPADAQQLSVQQTQAIGPIEDNSSWTIPGKDDPQTPTVIAHDGADGQMIRGRGALSFRIGDFFSGKDEEQMRLTEGGNLGIGTSEPKAKLDVAGAIRAERFLIAKPRLASGDKTAGAAQADSDTSVQPLVGGTGTQNQITKWTDNAGTLGDSVITENSGNIGIGTTSPTSKLEVNGGFLTVGTSPANKVYVDADGTGAYLQSSGASSLRFYSGSAEVLRLLNSGRVGIGTTSPTSKLEVNGGYLTVGTSPTNKMYVDADATGAYLQSSGTSSLRLFSGATEAVRVLNSGNVGIGIATPGSKLDVAGDINTSTQFNLRGSPILSAPGAHTVFAGIFAGANNTGNSNAFFGALSGINGTGSNNSFFGTFSGAHANNTGSGNAFFGAASGVDNTTGFGNAFFGEKSGQFNQDGSLNTFIGMEAGNDNTSGALNTFIGTSAGFTNDTGQNNTAVGYRADVGSGALINATAIGANAAVSQSNSLVLGSINGANFSSNDTRVGIGTTAPANPLDVNGVGTQPGGVGGFSEVAARFRNRTAGTHSALSIDALSGQDAILYLAENGAAVWGIRNDSDQGGKFQIRYQGSGANAPHLTVLPSGEVGIGQTSPFNKLEISTSANNVLGAFSSNTIGSWFNLGATDTGGRTWNLVSTASGTPLGAGRFVIRDNNASAARVVIDTSGNLAIGIDSPLDKLHVAGDIRVGTGTTGCVKDADGTVLTGTCSSDIRFKRNITPFPKLLDRLVRLQPVNFYWKASEYPQKGFGASQSFGLVAQDVEQVLPELVIEDEHGFKAVRYNKLPLLTLQGLKELKADNDSLRRENEALKQRIEAQEVRLRKLEAKLDQ